MFFLFQLKLLLKACFCFAEKYYTVQYFLRNFLELFLSLGPSVFENFKCEISYSKCNSYSVLLFVDNFCMFELSQISYMTFDVSSIIIYDCWLQCVLDQQSYMTLTTNQLSYMMFNKQSIIINYHMWLNSRNGSNL